MRNWSTDKMIPRASVCLFVCPLSLSHSLIITIIFFLPISLVIVCPNAAGDDNNVELCPRSVPGQDQVLEIEIERES